MLRKSNPVLYLNRKRSFVNATSELIRSQPFSSISIRKIADAAGCHNSTIYSYFQDSDWLLALASVSFLQPYSDDLLNIQHQELTPYEGFFDIWSCYCRHAFSSPALYYNFFFGKYKTQLTDLLEEYYTLFPDFQNTHHPLISNMFLGSNMFERSMSILEPLVNDSRTRITDSSLSMANTIIVSTLEEYLLDLKRKAEETGSAEADAAESLSEADSRECTELTDKFLAMLHFIIDR